MADNKIPVFVINGFLEAGKTQFMKFTMEQDYFQTDGKTLLILCEEGEEEYDKELLARTNTELISIEDMEELTIAKMLEWERAYDPERVLIEWNGLWLQDKLQIPNTWFINQMVSLFDTSTIDLYIKNMKSYMGPMLKNSELIICNRADDISEEKLGSYHLLLRAMSPDAEIVFEGASGEIRGDFSIELPYDLDADLIQIQNEDYGIFYVDAMDRTDKYDGKRVEFKAQVMKPPGIGTEFLIPGRRVMTCCADDMQFLGMLCHYSGAKNLKNGDWVKVRAKIKVEHSKAYGGVGPVLYAEEVIMTGAVNDVISFG